MWTCSKALASNMHLPCTNARNSCLPKNNGKDKVNLGRPSPDQTIAVMLQSKIWHPVMLKSRRKGRWCTEWRAASAQYDTPGQNLQHNQHVTISPWTDISPCTPRLLTSISTVSGHWTSDLGIVKRGPGSCGKDGCRAARKLNRDFWWRFNFQDYD